MKAHTRKRRTRANAPWLVLGAVVGTIPHLRTPPNCTAIQRLAQNVPDHPSTCS